MGGDVIEGVREVVRWTKDGGWRMEVEETYARGVAT